MTGRATSKGKVCVGPLSTKLKPRDDLYLSHKVFGGHRTWGLHAVPSLTTMFSLQGLDGLWGSKNVVNPARSPYPLLLPDILRCAVCHAASWFVTFTHVIVCTRPHHHYHVQLSSGFSSSWRFPWPTVDACLCLCCCLITAALSFRALNSGLLACLSAWSFQ